ncbi:MAG: hypothetical protein KIT17_09780 [Rubrivivax sp.]|nr:hypothetical protein [Rubrivivax sp.]
MKRTTMSSIASTILLTTFAGAAFAQQEVAATQSIEVTAPRASVRVACRSVDEQLQDMLGHVAWREAEGGTLDVSFTIADDRVEAVQVSGGPLAYRRATAGAVHRLDCHSGGQGRQSVRMQVVFLDREASAQRERIVAVEPALLARR